MTNAATRLDPKRDALRQRTATRQRGVSVLLVLGLLAMTLAISYAMVRQNFTVERTHTNYQRIGDSRQAAYAGLSTALRKMQQSDWSGIGVNLTGSLANGLSYSVVFVSGDSSLVSGSADYGELPYRVTVTSTGLAVDPAKPTVSSSYKVQAVVRLIPRKLCDPPTNWSTLQNYTLYQWSSAAGDTLSLDLPVRIEGPILAQNTVAMAPSYPGDAEQLQFAGQIDEVAVFGEALSQTQIDRVYQGTSTLSSLAAGNRIAWLRFNEPSTAWVAKDEFGLYHGIYDGGKPGGSPAPVQGGTGSATFDGVNDHVHFGVIDAPGAALTILAWIKPTSFPSDFGRIISKTDSTDSNDHIWAISNFLNSGRRCLRFRLKTNVLGTTILDATNVNLVPGQWAHIAAVYDGTKMMVYQNGVLMNWTLKLGLIPSAPTVFASIGNTPSGSPRAKYLRDVSRLFAYDGTDFRPLTGPITAPFSKTSANERSLVTDELQTAWNDVGVSGTAPVNHPGALTNYRLYPGGKTYTIPTLDATLRNKTFAPDPATNPLGVYYRLGNLDVRENVTFTGVLIVNANDSTPDIEIYGTNVKFNPVTLPNLDGSSTTTQLPVAIVKDDLRVYDGAAGEIKGLTVNWGEFGFQTGSQDTAFTVTGRVMANEFNSQPRTEWNSSGSTWNNRLRSFLGDLTSANPILFFPKWLEANRSLHCAPKLVVRPPQSSETFHWHDWSQPLFVAHPSDGGLRWELLDLRELP